MATNSNILIIVGGPVKKLDPFREPAQALGLNITFASFSDLVFCSDEASSDFTLKIADTDLASFDLIYIRMVGKRLEDISLLAAYAKAKRVKLVDHLYQNAHLLPTSIAKSKEMKALIESGLPLPQTYFASLSLILKNAPALFNYPFVIKSTSGKKARDVWFIQNPSQLNQIIAKLRPRQAAGDRFFAQKLIPASQRLRVFVLGTQALAAITQPTKYPKKVLNNFEFVGEKGQVPLTNELSTLAVKAAQVLSLDIAGVDFLKHDQTGQLYLIEANAAPSWNLIKKYAGINVETEILKYLAAY